MLLSEPVGSVGLSELLSIELVALSLFFVLKGWTEREREDFRSSGLFTFILDDEEASAAAGKIKT